MLHQKTTNLVKQNKNILSFLKNLSNSNRTFISFQVLSILLGFFASTALSTIPAQTGDWSIVAAAIIVTNQEIISKIAYQNNNLQCQGYSVQINKYLQYCNNIKIGIIYGLFVDAFKLGS